MIVYLHGPAIPLSAATHLWGGQPARKIKVPHELAAYEVSWHGYVVVVTGFDNGGWYTKKINKKESP